MPRWRNTHQVQAKWLRYRATCNVLYKFQKSSFFFLKDFSSVPFDLKQQHIFKYTCSHNVTEATMDRKLP